MNDMSTRSDKVELYASGNLRFRKAFIRERLEALKVERETLMAEREKINEMLAAKTPKASEASAA